MAATLVTNKSSGVPKIILSDEALVVCNRLGAGNIHLSLPDEEDMAFVVLST